MEKVILRTTDKGKLTEQRRKHVGVVQQFNADQGLPVSWGGFNSKVIAEAASSFFTVRLWDSGDLPAAVLGNYHELPDHLRVELPLKKVCVPASEEQGT